MVDCSPDYPVAGMQAGEELATILRLAALMASVSVMFPWLSFEKRNRMRVFFLHWFSAVIYVICKSILSVMVLNCWSSRRVAGRVIFIVKFVELASLNLWSISSVAIALLIASIVQAFDKCRRVPSKIGTARASYACVALAVAATVPSASFWNSLIFTGGYVWVTNTDSSISHWISVSFGATQSVAGLLMAATMLFTVSGKRLGSLKACCQTSNRVKFHFILAIFGTCVNIYSGVTLLVDELSDSKISRRLVVIGWCSRYIHIIADTGIVFKTFYALEAANQAGAGTQGFTDARTGRGAPALPPRPVPPTAEGSASKKRASLPDVIAEETPFCSVEAGDQETPQALEQPKGDATTGGPVDNEKSGCGDTGNRQGAEDTPRGGQKSPSFTLPSIHPRAHLHSASRIACAE